MLRVSFFIFMLSFSLISCRKTPELYVFEGDTQGTTYRILFETDTEIEIDKSEIDTLLRRFDLSLSTYIPNSLISKINNNEPYEKVDTFFNDMYLKAYEVYNASDGMFDITVKPLVNVYGFGSEAAVGHIDSLLIDSLLQFVGMENTKLVNGKIEKSRPDIKFDSNALAQGQAVDVVAKFLERKGVQNMLVEIGGEVMCKGTKFGQPWTVGVDKPNEGSTAENRELQSIMHLSDKALATSGNYRKYVEIDGKKYHHTINPKTGYPAYHNLLSVTIIARDCMTADAYATACMASGLEQAKAMLEENSELEAYFIYTDETGAITEFFTKGMKSYFE